MKKPNVEPLVPRLPCGARPADVLRVPGCGFSFVHAILAEPLRPEAGGPTVPTGPGLGIELDDQLIERTQAT